jgi:hypothetical protein
MRFAFSAFFAAALFAVPFLSGAAPTPTPAPRLMIPETGRAIKLVSPVPTSLTLSIPSQTPPFAPVALSGMLLTVSTANGKVAQSLLITLPIGPASTRLESMLNRQITLSIFIPPSTTNMFKSALITAFTENASGNQGSVQFTLIYGEMVTKSQ